jgi:hypothetical protein
LTLRVDHHARTIMTEGFGEWSPDRPSTLVVACSDGRLQEATDQFLGHHLEVTRYDRFYVPGGGGALAASGRDFLRAKQLRRECRYLVDLHRVRHIVLLFHGPTIDGPIAAACADYRRKLPWASVRELRGRQEQDAEELRSTREEWAGEAVVAMYRCEVDARGSIRFADLAGNAPNRPRREWHLPTT